MIMADNSTWMHQWAQPANVSLANLLPGTNLLLQIWYPHIKSKHLTAIVLTFLLKYNVPSSLLLCFYYLECTSPNFR